MDVTTLERYIDAERVCETLPPYQDGTRLSEWLATFTDEQRAAYLLLLDHRLATGTY